MTTATTYAPLTIATIDRAKWDHDGDIAEGEGLGSAAVGFTEGHFAALPDDHPAIIGWERLVDEAIAEINPQIGDMLYGALARRLPWTWEPER